MLPYARLTPGRGFRPKESVLYYSHRLVVAPPIRKAITRSITAAINFHHRVKPAPVAASHLPIIDSLRRDGIVDFPMVTPASVEKILSHIRDQPVFHDNTQCSSLDDLPPGTPLASYAMSTILSCKEVIEIASDPLVIEIASNYLGCRPTISSMGIRWSFSRAASKKATQNFHRDLDDWRTVKYFIYLTDVYEDTGPHTYVKGTHNFPCEMRGRLYTPEEVRSRFGDDAIASVTGNKGRAFLADMHGIHRGNVPERCRRLILQIQYSILPVYAFQYSPAEVELPPGVDRYMFRLLVK